VVPTQESHFNNPITGEKIEHPATPNGVHPAPPTPPARRPARAKHPAKR